MSLTNKEHFVAVLTEAETSGLLPKGKTADILENYDFLADAIDKRTLLADDRPTIPEGDSSTGTDFVKGRGKNKNPPPDAA